MKREIPTEGTGEATSVSCLELKEHHILITNPEEPWTSLSSLTTCRYLSIEWQCSWGDVKKCLLTSDKEPTIDQSKDNKHQSQTWRIRVSLLFLTRTWVRGYENRNESKTPTAPKAHPGNDDRRQSWNHEAHCTTCRKFNRSGSISS